jgi:pilus assembly protein CpaC
VSTIDFSLGTTLVVGGDPVPGLNTRRANTTVELRPGQTLAMAGLLQVELDGRTSRIPGLGDLPYLGPFFSNTTHRRVEKELVVLVTPHFAGALDAGHGIQLPGENVEDPTDWELYFKNRYEGRTGLHHRSTIEYGFDQPRRLMYHEKKCIQGPVGFSD